MSHWADRAPAADRAADAAPHAPAHTAGPGHPHQETTGGVLDEAGWDERYRSAHTVWSGRPNPLLVSEAAALPVGTALDAGCGEGADAIWLAARGWRVTAVDISTVALDRAAAHAQRADPTAAQRITWLHADLTRWTPRVSTYDLVSAQFLHLPKQPREQVQRRLAAAVAEGGSLLVVGHHPSDLDTTVPRPRTPDLFFTAAEVVALLDPRQWEIVVGDVRARDTEDPGGRLVTVHDALLLARRRADPV